MTLVRYAISFIALVIATPLVAVAGMLGARLASSILYLISDAFGPMPVGIPSAPIGEILGGIAWFVQWNFMGVLPAAIFGFVIFRLLPRYALIDQNHLPARIAEYMFSLTASFLEFYMFGIWCNPALHRATIACRDYPEAARDMIWPIVICSISACVWCAEETKTRTKRVRKPSGPS